LQVLRGERHQAGPHGRGGAGTPGILPAALPVKRVGMIVATGVGARNRDVRHLAEAIAIRVLHARPNLPGKVAVEGVATTEEDTQAPAGAVAIGAARCAADGL